MHADPTPEDQELARLLDAELSPEEARAWQDWRRRTNARPKFPASYLPDLPVVPAPKQRREFDTTMTITSWERARPARHIPEGDDA